MKPAMDLRVSHVMAFSVVAAAVAVTWSIHYVPLSMRRHRTQHQVRALTQQLTQTEELLASVGGQAAWMAQQRQRLQAVQQRFPSAAHIPPLLDTLLGQVSSAELALVNVNQGNLEAAKDVDGRPMTLNQHPYLGFPVTLSVAGRYHAIVAFLDQLGSAEFPAVVNVERVELALTDPAKGTLNATLQLRLFVVGP